MQFLQLTVRQEGTMSRAVLTMESPGKVPLWFRIMESAKSLDREIYKATGHVLREREWETELQFVD